MKIVVSGIGLVTPLGSSRESTWTNLLAGRSAIQDWGGRLEARVMDFSPNGARSRMGDFAILSAGEAIRHAGYSVPELQKINVGVVMGQSKPIVAGEYLYSPPLVGGGRGRGVVEPCFSGNEIRKTNLSPFPTLPHKGEGTRSYKLDSELILSSFTGWSASDVVRREFHLNGTSVNVVAACATGVSAIQMGMQMLRSGQCDFVLAGASESSLNDFYRTGFEQMGVLATGGVRSARPFDRDRTGFVMGEGAAAFFLETEEHAQKRGHTPLAMIEGISLRQNPHDIIKTNQSGAAIARLIESATNGNLPDYVNAHGTGTQMNDAVESAGLRLALRERANKTPISSTKAATGHLLGAAGAVEAAFTVLALRDQKIPPTLNWENGDDDCELDFVPEVARAAELNSTLSLSYGFGGQMGAVYFKKIGSLTRPVSI